LVFNTMSTLGAQRVPTLDELGDLTNAVAAGDTRGAALAASVMLQ
jgi:hypothetical protein